MRAVTRRAAAVGIAASLTLVTVGCGGDGQRRNEPRPATRIVLTASISPDRVSVSPRRFGAGPIEPRRREPHRHLPARHARDGRPRPAGDPDRTAPINPRDTAELRADLRRGRYTVHVTGGGDPRGDAARRAARRPSAQNDLLQP